MTPIIKLLRAAEWAQFQADGVFHGSPDDLRDGFIHLSTPAQTPKTAAQFFAGEPTILALTLDADQLGAALKWDTTGSGSTYPHLYRPLALADVIRCEEMPAIG